MTTDTPHAAVALLREPLMAKLLCIEIMNFK